MPDLVRPSDASPDEPVTAHQRVGAYGVLLRENRTRMLMTRIAQKDYGAGTWTLPGGGLDHGEDPIDAVVREFHEETSLAIIPRSILLITSAHFLGRNRAGVLEDFHGLSIVYDVEGQPGTDLDSLTVLEVDSSTDHVEWLDVAAIYNPLTDEFDRGYSPPAQAAIKLVSADLKR